MASTDPAQAIAVAERAQSMVDDHQMWNVHALQRAARNARMTQEDRLRALTATDPAPRQQGRLGLRAARRAASALRHAVT